MSYSFDGAGDIMTGSFTSAYNVPFALVTWIKIANHLVVVDRFISVGNTNNAEASSVNIRTENVDNQFNAEAKDASAVASSAQIVLTIDGVWTCFLAQYRADDLITLYVGERANSASSGVTRAFSDVQHIRLGENFTGGADFAGLQAESAFITGTLSDTEIDDIMSGVRVSGVVSGAALKGYWPLDTDNTTQANEGSDTAGDLSVTGAVFDADHPTITEPTGTAPTLYVSRSAIRLV